MRFKNRFALTISVTMIILALSSFISTVDVGAAKVLTWPVPGHETLSCSYHCPQHPDHAGIDISDGSITGANVVSACDGTVFAIYKCPLNHYYEPPEGAKDPNTLSCCKGNGTALVILGTDNRLYVYGHMQADSIPSNVYRTASVSAGQTIGKVGNTGNSSGAHLHFQINDSSSDYWTKSLAVNPKAETYSGGGGGGNVIPGTKWEPANDFYAFIIRPDKWIKVDSSASNSNNVQLTTSTDSESDASCFWRFEKQSNGTYVIYNQRNGYVLDAYGAGTTNGTNVYTYKEYVGGKNQQWILYDTGSGTVIKNNNCDLVLDCAGGNATSGTNIQLHEYNGTQAQKFNIYTIAKRWNPSSYDAYTYIIRQSPWLHIENSSTGNVQIRSNGNNGLDPKQVWWLCKLSDGSFNIANAYNDGSVNAYLTASGTTSGANVSTSKFVDSTSQRWYIYKLEEEYGSYFFFRAKGNELVMNCNGGASTAGTNINLASFNKVKAQIFDLWYLSYDNRTYSRPGNPNVPTLTAPSSALAGANISLSWTSSPLKNDFDARSYRVEVLDSSNKVVKQTTTTSLSATITIDNAGTYSIQVRAINTKYPGDSISSVSAKKSIVVSSPVKTLTSSMVTSIPDQTWTGSAITPTVTVKDGSTTLKSGTDYTVAYSNNVNAGDATVTITGKGNYTGTVSVKFKIVRPTYTVSLVTVTNGTAGLSKTTAYSGDEITVTTTPATGYILDKILVNSTAITGNKFTMPAKNTTVEVVYKKISYNVTLSSVANGSANLSKTTAGVDDEIIVTTTPNACFELDAILVNGTAITGNKFTMPAANVTVEVTFKAKPHNISKVEAKSPTCTEDGYKEYYECSVCHKLFSDAEGKTIISKPVVVSKLGHKLTAVPEKAPSKIEPGNYSYYECERCHKIFKDSDGKQELTQADIVIPVMTHYLTLVKAKAATCTEPGNTVYYVCSDSDCGCKKVYSDKNGQHEINIGDTVILPTGHKIVEVPAKEATCTEDGHDAYFECNNCHEKYSDAAGKNVITNIKTYPKLDHHWDNGKVIIAPKCEEQGSILYICINGCHVSKREPIPATGHDKEHIIHHAASAPTHNDDGNREYYECPECHKKFADPDCKKELSDADIVIPKKGAPVLGETATVDGLSYKVTNPSTDGTGTVTLTGVETRKHGVVIPDTVEIEDITYIVDRIATKAFYKDLTIKTLVIGANIRFIDSYAFYGCKNLVKVSGGAKLETIATNVFAYCSKLKNFAISSPVLRQIGAKAFYKDKKLKTIYIKNTVKLTKAGVKKSLKGSSVKKVKVKKSKVKAYKKIFKKKNSGRSVKVKK